MRRAAPPRTAPGPGRGAQGSARRGEAAVWASTPATPVPGRGPGSRVRFRFRPRIPPPIAPGPGSMGGVGLGKVEA